MSSSDTPKGLSAKARAVSDRVYKGLLRFYPLAALRNARGLTQADIAKALKRSQAAISKIEGRQDFLISSLNRYVQATGGRFEVHVTYPDAAFRIVHDEASDALTLRNADVVQRAENVLLYTWGQEVMHSAKQRGGINQSATGIIHAEIPHYFSGPGSRSLAFNDMTLQFHER